MTPTNTFLSPSARFTTNDGFTFRIERAATTATPEINGSVASPGYHFIVMAVKVTNLQSDRSAPLDSSEIPRLSTLDQSVVNANHLQGCKPPGPLDDPGVPPTQCIDNLATGFNQVGAPEDGIPPSGAAVWQIYFSEPEGIALNSFHIYVGDLSQGSARVVPVGP